MNRKRIRRLIWGGAVGSAAMAAAVLIQRARERREELAQADAGLTQDAIADLGVTAGSMFVTVNGVRLHAVVAGPSAGPLVVLLHGFPEAWYDWRHQIPALVHAGYRVVALDQRGYNLSDKPAGVENYSIDQLTSDVLEVIRTYGYQRAVIVGHDWGGAVAWRFAAQYPEATEQLIVMNAPHPAAYRRELKAGWTQRLRSWYIAFFQIPWLPEALLGLAPAATARLFFRGTSVRKNAFSNAELAVLEAALAQPGMLHAAIDWYRAGVRYGVGPARAPIHAPTLLIWGEEDIALDLALTYGLEEWVPDLTVHRIPNVGHWVQNEAPEEVNRVMLTFLRAHAQTPLQADLPEAAAATEPPDMEVEQRLEPHVVPEEGAITREPTASGSTPLPSAPSEPEGLPGQSRAEPRSD